MRLSIRNALATAALTAVLAGCDGGESTPSTPAPGDEALTIVEPGKEDNFLSQSAQEYLLTGTTTVTLESEWADRTPDERLARARALVPYRQTVVGWFLGQYVQAKSDHDSNQTYGGFKALTKNGSWEDLGLREIDALTFEVDVRQEMAGPLNLLDVLPTELDASGVRTFELTMGRVSTEEMQRLDVNAEWYREAPWSGFDPSKVDAARTETIKLTVTTEPRPADAWFDYAQLIDDGVLDIGVHFGWDYHKEYHLVHSRSVYGKLVGQGFKSPVGSYEELKRDSGPLQKTLQTPLGEVEVRVSLFWGQPGTDTDPDTDAGGRVLEQDMRASLQSRDVIVYSGHSGPFYGFALANWRKTSEGDVDDSELSEVEMPDRYQVVLAEGCDTYAIGQGFFLNPAKADRKNLDIITTTSFSNASTDATVADFLAAFVTTDAPRLSRLLDDLDQNSSWFATMYGVHGIDDNPRRHPFADEARLCDACARDADCGGKGNSCVAMADGVRACTFECTADDGCPEGFQCRGAASGGWIRTQVCVSSRATCEAVEPPRVPLVFISKVVPNPDGDLNGDGVADSRDDEAVTLVNEAGYPTDLSGWSLADNVGVRFTFPQGYELKAGDQVTVFGGGEADFTAPRGLGLNNDGDAVHLLDARGAEVQVVSWRRATRGVAVVGR